MLDWQICGLGALDAWQIAVIGDRAGGEITAQLFEGQSPDVLRADTVRVSEIVTLPNEKLERSTALESTGRQGAGKCRSGVGLL